MDARFSRLARLAVLGIVTAALVGTLVTTLPAPVAALDGDSGATYTNPRAPGGEGRYTVTVVAERNDTIVRNGLAEITLDFGADRDFSGDITRVANRDVDVYLERRNAGGAVSLGAVNVSHGDEGTLAVRFEPAVGEIGPGDRIVVRVANVTNTEIAARDPQGVRSFAMRVTTAGPDGNTDGPVEVRYEIDPNATASSTNTTDTAATNASAANGDGAASDGRNASDATGTNASATSGDGTTDTAAAPAGGSGSTSGSALVSAAGTPTIVGVGAIGVLGVGVLGVSYVVYGRRKRRSKGRNGPGGGRERL